MILVLNCGSQSIKYKVFDKDFKTIKSAQFVVGKKNQYQAILKKELGKIRNIDKVCHRVVHGGGKYRDPIKLGRKNLAELKKYNRLAPLHNPYNIQGIEISFRTFPKAEQVAVFDTGFYKDIPPKAYLYALPENLRGKYGFKRFGFHGISHEYAARKGAEKIGKKFGSLNIISCHLGGGSSVTAIRKGKAVDTSMGFTPLEGVVMMTRAGSIDPGIILQLGKHLSFKELDDVLNRRSGLLGISGSSDMLDILKRIKKGDKKAKIALEVFVYSVQKQIGSYLAALGGCDLLVFTGAIGSGSALIRNMICKNLNILNRTKIVSVKTDEELMIAQKSKHV